MTRVVIEEPADTRRLLELLGRDRVRNAYPIGALAPGYAEQARWFWVMEQGEPTAVLTIYHGLTAPALFTWGDVDKVTLLASRLIGQLPDRVLLHRYPEHAAAFEDRLCVRGVRRVVRMSLTRENFTPVETERELVRLGHSDTSDILTLYATFPDSFFEPYQLESGFYFGIKENDELMSVAGIHLYDRELKFAMLGNIVTSPGARGKRYAQMTTSRLCTELFDFSDLLILDVPMEGNAAMKVFAKLGFKPEFYYDQVLALKARQAVFVGQE